MFVKCCILFIFIISYRTLFHSECILCMQYTHFTLWHRTHTHTNGKKKSTQFVNIYLFGNLPLDEMILRVPFFVVHGVCILLLNGSTRIWSNIEKAHIWWTESCKGWFQGTKKNFFFSSLLFLYCSCNCVCVCVPGWGVEWVDGWTVKPSNHEAFNECFFANDVKSGIENYFIPHKVWIPISILLLLLLSIFISIFHWIHCSELLLWFCSCHTMHI